MPLNVLNKQCKPIIASNLGECPRCIQITLMWRHRRGRFLKTCPLWHRAREQSMPAYNTRRENSLFIFCQLILQETWWSARDRKRRQKKRLNKEVLGREIRGELQCISTTGWGRKKGDAFWGFRWWMVWLVFFLSLHFRLHWKDGQRRAVWALSARPADGTPSTLYRQLDGVRITLNLKDIENGKHCGLSETGQYLWKYYRKGEGKVEKRSIELYLTVFEAVFI